MDEHNKKYRGQPKDREEFRQAWWDYKLAMKKEDSEIELRLLDFLAGWKAAKGEL